MNLVFVHGAGGTSKVWQHQKRYFSTAYEVTALTLSGHGRTGGEGCPTIDAYAEEVRQKISDADTVLVGHSMGGGITMKYALTYPLKACVLVGTGAKLRVLPAILEQITTDYEKTVDLILEYAIYNKTESIMRHSKEEFLTTSPEVTYNDFLACDHFNVMEEIERLRIPALIICGSQDMLTPPKYSEYLAAKIKPSCIYIIPDSGHMVMLEKPEEFNKILEKFLKDLE